MQMLLGLCRSRVLHTLTLNCFERHFSLLFPLVGENNYLVAVLWHIHEQMHCISKKSDAEHSHASITQLISSSGSQSIDGSITQFFLVYFQRSVQWLNPLYLSQMSMYEAHGHSNRITHFQYHTDIPQKLFWIKRKCSISFVHFSRVWTQSKIPSECISLNGKKLFWIMHAMNGLLKRSPTSDVTEGLKQNTRNSVIGLERLKFILMKQKTFCLLFLVYCLEDKISPRLPLCTRLNTFQSGSSGFFRSQESEDCI